MNEPIKTIEEFVEKDLSCYGQHNPCPKSLTIVEGKNWRHYELGSILGFLIFNQSYTTRRDGKDVEEEGFYITTIEEDDEYWFAPSHPMYMSAAWTIAVDNTWKRMVEWRKKHLIMGWEKGANITNPEEYKNEVKVPIVPEVIEWEDEEPDNAVLGTKYVYIDEEEEEKG